MSLSVEEQDALVRRANAAGFNTVPEFCAALEEALILCSVWSDPLPPNGLDVWGQAMDLTRVRREELAA